MHTPPPAEVHHEAVTRYVSAVAQANSANGPCRSHRRRATLTMGLRSRRRPISSANPAFREPMLTPYAVEQSSVAGKGGAKPIKLVKTQYPIQGVAQSWRGQNAHRLVAGARHGACASPLDAARGARSTLYEQYQAKAGSNLYQHRKCHVAAHPISEGVEPATRLPRPWLLSWHQASHRRFQFPLWGGESCLRRMRRNSVSPSIISGPSVYEPGVSWRASIWLATLST